ncbi:MAG: substrate-binding domain-containing protein [Chloroflexi bacterium]|nr:substrate-binding domain-containing protein [Chloroflexota bacterium]
MKRNILLLTLMLIFGLLFVACGGGAEDETPEETTTETTEETTTEETTTEETTTEETTTEETEETTEEAMGEGSIAVLLPDSASSARWEADDRRFFEEAFDAAGVEYSIVNAEGDARTQQTQAEQAITNGAKVLLLVNLDSGSGAAIIAQAREAGVKVIDYDRLTIEGPGADVYVSFDNVSVGRLMGETLEPVIDGLGVDTPQVVQLNGSPTDNNATLFREGYFSIAEPHYDDGSWALVDDQAVPDWDNQQALVIFEQILTAVGGDVDAVFAANDGLGNSVISALKSQGLDPLPVSGQDATVAGIQNILSGWQTMTVYKPIKLEAEAAAEAAIALLKGEDVSALTSDTLNNGQNDVPFMKLTPIAVTKDNIADTVIADGFRTWEEICVGDFEQYCAAAQGDGEEEMAEAETMEGCNVDLTGETIVLHQQAGREGPVAAILGEAFAFATEDALNAINSDGGVCGATLEVAFNETNYDVEQEVAVYEQTRDEAILIFTYASGATVALAERLNEDKILSFAAGVNGPAIYVPRNGYTVADIPIYSDQFAGFLLWLSENWADVKPESAGDDIVVGVIGWANAYGAGATTDEALAIADELGITVLPLEEQAISPDADVSGQLQNMLVNGANVVYNQNLSFSVAQVIGTLRALGVWDDVVVGGVSWSFNSDVLNFLGENAALAGDYYGVVPHLTWADTDAEIIQESTAAFDAGGYPETERTNTFLLTYATFFAVRDILVHAVNEYGFENLSGETMLMAANDIGVVDARGLFEFDLQGENRGPNKAHIRQWQVRDDGTVIDVPITDFFELPDTRPPAD